MQFTIVWRGNEQEACAILIIDVLYGKKGDFYEYYNKFTVFTFVVRRVGQGQQAVPYYGAVHSVRYLAAELLFQ